MSAGSYFCVLALAVCKILATQMYELLKLGHGQVVPFSQCCSAMAENGKIVQRVCTALTLLEENNVHLSQTTFDIKCTNIKRYFFYIFFAKVRSVVTKIKSTNTHIDTDRQIT